MKWTVRKTSTVQKGCLDAKRSQLCCPYDFIGKKVKYDNGILAVANRIFETWLYNLYLSTADMQNSRLYSASLLDKNGILYHNKAVTTGIR